MLRVTERGYRAWRDRPMSQRTIRHEMLAETIANIHRASRGCYGARRVHAELVHGLGIRVGRDQVARVMARTGLRGLAGTRKRYVNREHLVTTEDLVNRDFTATAPNQLWCTDITEHPTREGKIYCCCVIDVYSRKIVGWAIDMRQTTDLVLNALDMAVEARKPSQTVVHSDHGQFRARRFRRALRRHGLVGSMGRVGAAGDNAAMESFFSTLQTNVLDSRRWATMAELRLAGTHWIEATYHQRRRQRRLGRLTPVEYQDIMRPVVALAA